MEPANVLFCGASAALLASGFFNEYGEVLPWPSYDPQASLASRFSLLRRIKQAASSAADKTEALLGSMVRPS